MRLTIAAGAAVAIGGAPLVPVAARPVAAVPIAGRAAMQVDEIDRRLDALVAQQRIAGLGVALVRDGRVAYLHAIGKRSASGEPLTPDSVMDGASLTKAAFAVFVMQQVDAGRLALDRPIGDALPRPLPEYPRYADLADDARWRGLTLRHLLDHASGFANFRWLEPDGRLRLHREPGARYGYSGEGFELAQFVVEQATGLEIGDAMQHAVFDPLGLSRTSMTWRADFADDVADRFLGDGAVRAHRHRMRADAAGSMDTTLRDMATFAAALVRGDAMPAAAKAEMIRRQIVIDSPTQFPTLGDARTDRDARLGLGYGLGWGVFTTPEGPAFFKEGHDDGTGNYLLCIDRTQSCIVLMSNSDRGESLFKTLVEMLMNVEIPWEWEHYPPLQ